MSLADHANAPPPFQQKCLTCLWYDALPEKEQQALDTLAARDDISGSYLYRICVEEGLPCGETSLKRHLRQRHVSH